MIAEIIVRKAKKNGIDGFIFEEFKNVLKINGLPNEYLNDYTCKFYTCKFYLNPYDALAVFPGDGSFKSYKLNDFISKENFHKLISILKQAGQRLTDINRELEKNWISDKKITIKI